MIRRLNRIRDQEGATNGRTDSQAAGATVLPTTNAAVALKIPTIMKLGAPKRADHDL